jgi:hypothetical protein
MYCQKFTLHFLFLFLFVLITPARAAKVCIAPLPSGTELFGRPDQLGSKASEFLVQVDQKPAVKIVRGSSSEEKEITNLSSVQKHLLKIKNKEGKVFESFFFTFEKNSKLCLFQHEFYATWQLQDKGWPGTECKCK